MCLQSAVSAWRRAGGPASCFLQKQPRNVSGFYLYLFGNWEFGSSVGGGFMVPLLSFKKSCTGSLCTEMELIFYTHGSLAVSEAQAFGAVLLACEAHLLKAFCSSSVPEWLYSCLSLSHLEFCAWLCRCCLGSLSVLSLPLTWKENHSVLPQWYVLLGFSPCDGGSSSSSPWKVLGRWESGGTI